MPNDAILSRLSLPAPAATTPLACYDKTVTLAWLAAQPQAQSSHMAAVLLAQIQALDAAATLPPRQVLTLLDLLREPIFSAAAGLAVRYARKALPLPREDKEIFHLARRLWRALAVAYLRRAAELPPAETALPLNRAAAALRQEQQAHWEASWEPPADLYPLFYRVMAVAAALKAADTPVEDEQFKSQGPSSVASLISGAFLMAAMDPFRPSPGQLTVVNRAINRWRSLATFQKVPEESSRAKAFPLARLLGDGVLTEDGPRFLNVRPVLRKIRQRIESLEAGESPENLKLGRELSGTACIRLLREMEEALAPVAPVHSPMPMADTSLIFGTENIYTLISGKLLTPTARDKTSHEVNHQRIALFGFDTPSILTGPFAQSSIPSEHWTAAGEELSRQADAGERLQAPCLVACRHGQGSTVRLGVLTALRMAADGRLRGSPRWYAGAISCGVLSTHQQSDRLPFFIIAESRGFSVVLPAGAKVKAGLDVLAGGPKSHSLRLGEIVERGTDFVRYSAQNG